MKLDRRSFNRTLAGAALAATAPSLGTSSEALAAAEKKPNIVFILADDLGYGDLGCFGQKTISTPHIDQLAAEGVRFTDAYAGSTVCAPSRCSLMTGMHTGHCFIRGNSRIPIRPEDRTIAEVLKEAGYATGMFGKWGLGNGGTTGMPTKKGFDEFFGYLDQGHAHNYYPEHLWENDHMYEIQRNLGMSRRVYSHDLIMDRALGFLDNHKDDPFFLYLPFTIPHANNERGRAEGDGMEVPDYGEYEDKDWPNPQKGHAAMISKLDADVGRIMKKLRDLGLDDNTLVIFSSDNGPHREGGADPVFFGSQGPLRGYKRALYDGGIRVPTAARWPGKIEPGRTSDQIWAFWDLFPTWAELAGAAPTEGIDGTSIVPALLGDEKVERDPLYWEFHERRFAQAVRVDNWKGVRYGLEGEVELYDVRADIGEKHNIAANHPDVVERITATLDGARTESEHWKAKR